MLFFKSPLDCFSQRSELNNTRTSTYLPHSIRVLSLLSSPPLFKNHKNPEVDKKIQACETYIDRALYFPHADAQKSQYFAY